eukprot:TRINITY_DN16220_c0_g1_i6.p2 TRINITY_DN16220_c0_g1~~TRINITY_DN16220_c0_g1_i6.p2  ORF type:complete len:314 (+),score=57.14 TRINITY_DN16220_c0_g1_i6:88-1029(+)
MCIRDSINAEYGEQLQQAMVRTQVTIWKCLDVGGEVLTVGFAVFDIIMDVWIASTYYSDGRTGFFRLSLGLLGVAQVSYTFLFVFLFTPHEISNWKKAGWALVVLPFAQLVPLVVWLISMDFKTVNQLLRDLNMIKKSQPHRLENEDQLAYNIRCKLSSHIGFLVEACVEAVPQSVLQLVAMQHAGQANMLSVLSIVLSVCCLASKGYVASFSLHFRTFCFNIICFGADVVRTIGHHSVSVPGRPVRDCRLVVDPYRTQSHWCCLVCNVVQVGNIVCSFVWMRVWVVCVEDPSPQQLQGSQNLTHQTSLVEFN